MILAAALLLTLSAEAEDLYEEGARLYQVEKYEEAIDAFKRSYVISKKPGALYNIAQAYRFMGRCREALRYYRSYLTEKPKAADRANVEALIAKMGECPEKPVEEPPVVTEAPTPPPEPPLPPPTPINWAPWTLSAAGAIVAAAGLGLNIHEHQQFARYQQQCPCPESTWSKEPALEKASWALLVTGAIFLVAGIVWLVVSR